MLTAPYAHPPLVVRALCLGTCRAGWHEDKRSATAHESVGLQRNLERALVNNGVTFEQAELMARAALVDGVFVWGQERLPLETAE